MNSFPVRKQDYAFGQIMLRLRDAIGLSQARLAAELGVSRQAIIAWETGATYPKAEHLKKLVALALPYQTFRAGAEEEEIRALWRGSRQKALLDGRWLAELLAPIPGSPVAPAEANDANLAHDGGGPRLSWGEAPSAVAFYGRERELALLSNWILEQRCRVVGVLGLGGIGKSALSAILMRGVAERFDYVLWRSMRNNPTCTSLIESCLQVLAPTQLGTPATPAEQLSQLVHELRHSRVLLVLDNLETLLDETRPGGYLRPERDDYGEFLRQVAEIGHQSCVLLTSREKPGELLVQESESGPVRFLRLSQLDLAAAHGLLLERQLSGTAAEQERLVAAFAANPLALKIVSQVIVDLFGGAIGPFLAQGEIIFGGVRDLLAQQFDRLTPLGQTVLYWLAIMREPQSINTLRRILVPTTAPGLLLETVSDLVQRSMVERGVAPGSFSLQSVVLEYVTGHLLVEAGAEIASGRLLLLLWHNLYPAFAPEYVRQMQQQLLLRGLLEHSSYAHPSPALLEARLLELLAALRERPQQEQGYGPANLAALLGQQRGNLRGLNLSRLLLRSAYFADLDMQDASLAGATVHDSVFNAAFDTVVTIASSANGHYLAACTASGDVWLWELHDDSYALRRIWRNPIDSVWEIALSNDGTLLAGGTSEGEVRVWDVASGRRLWASEHIAGAGRIDYLQFAPNNKLLAASIRDVGVHLWKAESGANPQLLEDLELAIKIAWAPNSDMLAIGELTGRVQLWRVNKGGQAIRMLTQKPHEGRITAIQFAPDGKTLISTSADCTIKFWELAPRDDPHAVHESAPEGADNSATAVSLTLRETLDITTGTPVFAVWNASAGMMVFSGRNATIWLWDVTRQSYHATLRGHTTWVTGLAMTTDGARLFSSARDGSLRIWDVASGRCISTLQGPMVAIHDVAWSPDSKYLIRSGADLLLIRYSADGSAPAHILVHEENEVVSHAWSPDGRQIAAVYWRWGIDLRDAGSGARLQRLQVQSETVNGYYGAAFSPDGRLIAAGTSRYGALIWDLGPSGAGARLLWPAQPFAAAITSGIEWSPAGDFIAAGGGDGIVYIYDVAAGLVTRQLAGHQSVINGLAWSPAGDLLVSCSGDGSTSDFIVWDQASGAPVLTVADHPRGIAGIVWGGDEHTVVSGTIDGELRWWDVSSGACRATRSDHRGKIVSLRRSPDGAMLARFDFDGAIQLWDLRSGAYLRTLRRDRPYERMIISGIQGLSDDQQAALHSLGAITDGEDVS